MVLTTKLTAARPGSKSLRATVPEGIVEFLQLRESDELEWEMKTEEDKRVAVVRRAPRYQKVVHKK